MDCRVPLLVALGLVSVSAGCIGSRKQAVLPAGPGQHGAPGLTAKQPEPTSRANQQSEIKRPPQASTWVAWAVYREREAGVPKADPALKPKILDQARMGYLEAIKVDANHLPAYHGLARVYVQLDIPERAQETYQKALKRFPKEASVWHEMGMIYCRQKDWPSAIEHLKKAHDFEPENRQYAQSLGFCLARAGRIEESLSCLSRVMGVAQAHYNVARMLIHLQREDQARQHLQLAVAGDPRLQAAGQLLASLEGGGAVPGRTDQPELDIVFGSDNAAFPGQ